MNSPRIAVVVSRPIYPRNFGMCARALANMGGAQLIAVAPRFALDDERAKQGAAGAQDALSTTIVYADWPSFLAAEGEGVRIALSGKDGRLRTPELLEERLERMRSPALRDQTVPIYLILGPENDGLSPEELESAHHVCRLSTYGAFSSLNLSHACVVALYAVQRFLGTEPAPCAGGAGGFAEARAALAEKRAARGPFAYPERAIAEWLEALGFDLGGRRVHAGNALKRIFLENTPSPDDLRLLEAVVRQTTRKLRSRSE